MDIPVAGYGEAAMHVACMLGRRFSVVLFNPALRDLIEEEIARAGLAARAAPHALVAAEYGDVVDA